ncbi:MAG: UbiA family prenyltransferase [Candidatus Omnitrophica bacterium]|nr:UbiA family prenyltransferase [Candidatus Omnitrophota bacterium]
MMAKCTAVTQRIINFLTDDRVPFSYTVMTFLSVIIFRTFFEHTLLTQDSFWTDIWLDFFHFSLFWIVLALMLCLIFTRVTGEAIIKTARVVLPCFVILNIVPVIDRLLGVADKFHIGYFFADEAKSLWLRYLTLGGSLKDLGTTPGMRVEIALMTLVSAWYVWVLTRNWRKTLLGAVLFYFPVFLYGSLPVFLSAFSDFLHYPIPMTAGLAIRLYALVAMVLGIAFFYQADKITARALVRDIRLTRVLHYAVLIVLGVLCEVRASGRTLWFNPEEVFGFFFLLSSLLLAILFSLITNNIADQKIDQITNPDRPLVTGRIAPDLYNRIGWTCLGGSMVYALLAGAIYLEIMATFIGAYFVYSMPPLRLKRLPVLSKGVIGFNSLLMFMAGYMLHQGEVAIPLKIIVFFLVFLGLSSNFIDLKDIEGDRLEGIKTLPLLLGAILAKRIIGLAFVATYLAAYQAFSLRGFFWPCLAAGLLQFLLINRKNYDERPVMLVHVFSLLSIAAYVGMVR